jgi:hypothetical protein
MSVVPGEPERMIARTNFSVFECCPLESLSIQRKDDPCREDYDRLQTEFLPIIMLRFCSPTQECDDVLCILGSRTGSTCNYGQRSDSAIARKLTIVVFHDTIKEYTGHRNGATREIRVVVQTLPNFHSGWWVDVTSQQGENIVLEATHEKAVTE